MNIYACPTSCWKPDKDVSPSVASDVDDFGKEKSAANASTLYIKEKYEGMTLNPEYLLVDETLKQEKVLSEEIFYSIFEDQDFAQRIYTLLQGKKPNGWKVCEITLSPNSWQGMRLLKSPSSQIDSIFSSIGSVVPLIISSTCCRDKRRKW